MRRCEAPALDNAGSRHDTQRMHVLGHHGTRADDRAAADGDSWCDRGPGADPDILLNGDGGVGDEVVALVELEGMSSGAQGHPGTDQHAITDGDTPEVKEEASLVDEHALSERCAEAVVAEERREDRQRFRNGSTEDLGEQDLARVEVVERQHVEPRGQVHGELHALREGS